MAAPAPYRSGFSFALLALVLIPLIAHAAFSTLGFNPTDDGFVLAASRRLLAGEVPHRDFIAIRPVGSAVLHLPWLMIGGDATFWLARGAVWFEFALIAWAWTLIARQLAGRVGTLRERMFAMGLAFMLTSNMFPIMPWPTIDGIAFISLGLWLAIQPGSGRKAVGYLLIGASALFKQNFLVVIPVAIVLLGDGRKRGAWVAAIAPVAGYATCMLLLGAAPAAWEQLTTHTQLLLPGVVAYTGNPWSFAGMAIGLAIAWSLRRAEDVDVGVRRAWTAALVAALVLAAAFTLSRLSHLFSFDFGVSFLLFGAVLGAVVPFLFARGAPDGALPTGMLALLVAWSASISIGNNTPALAAGVLASPLLELALRPSTRRDPSRRHLVMIRAGFATAALACAVGWADARLNRIYRDQAASHLVWPLGRAMPGGRFIRTNSNTYDLMADLQRAVILTHGRKFAVIVDFSAYWVTSPQRNPLSSDWPQIVEVGTPALIGRIENDVEQLRGRGCIIVQKVDVTRIASTFRSIEVMDVNHYYGLGQYVRENFHRTDGTKWFDIYE